MTLLYGSFQQSRALIYTPNGKARFSKTPNTKKRTPTSSKRSKGYEPLDLHLEACVDNNKLCMKPIQIHKNYRPIG